MQPVISKALVIWLHHYYGQDLATHGISTICRARIGVSKVDALHHTFARSMEDAGAKVSEIQGRLGHSSLATTGRYLAALRSAENPHGEKVTELIRLGE